MRLNISKINTIGLDVKNGNIDVDAENLEVVAETPEGVSEGFEHSRGARHARNGCGCSAACSTALVLIVLILACLAAFVLDRCSPDTMVERSASAMDRLLKSINSQKSVVGDILVHNMSGADKYVAAQIDETVSRSCERTNFKLTATYKIKARANFEYCVNLSSFSLRFEYAPGGKIRAVANFGELRLSEPVAYKVISQESSTRPFVVDFDQMQSEFMREEFPKFLAEEGTNPKSMLAARYMAQKSLEKLLKTKIFPLMGIARKFAEENISEIVVNFDGPKDSENSMEIDIK